MIESAEPEALCCDGGATASLSSSFIGCIEIKERVVPINTAQGWTVMYTTHVGIKIYFVRDRTGELRPITTKTYIVKNSKRPERTSTKQDIESLWMKTLMNQECKQSKMVKCENPNIFHL